MPRTRECDFCGGDIEPGTGTMFVRTNGTTIHFCSSKCEKNADLGREARDLEWTAEGQARAPEETVGSRADVTETEPGADVAVEGEDAETITAEDVAEAARESDAIRPDVAGEDEGGEAEGAEEGAEPDAEPGAAGGEAESAGADLETADGDESDSEAVDDDAETESGAETETASGSGDAVGESDATDEETEDEEETEAQA